MSWSAVGWWAVLVVGVGVQVVRLAIWLRVRLPFWWWQFKRHQLWFNRPLPRGEWDTRIYEGLPGSGKSLLMVRDAIALMRRGVRVCSPLVIRDTLTGLESEPVSGWLDMLRWSVRAIEEDQPTVFCFDELQNWADARAWQATPRWWTAVMEQRRKYGIGIIGTTQNLETIEKRLRMLVGHQVRCRPSVLRWWWGRLPVFCTQEINSALVGVAGQDYGAGRWHATWVTSPGFHGYSTHSITAGLDFAELKDDEIVAEIRELTEQAMALRIVERLPAFVDSKNESVLVDDTDLFIE